MSAYAPTQARTPAGGPLMGRDEAAARALTQEPAAPAPAPARAGTPELYRALSEIKGQAQFLLYLADQIEDSLHQLSAETDPGHGAFLCKVLGMYSSQMESKHQGLGDKISEACQEVYVTVREYDVM